jgi:hypothetical protein
MWAFQFEATLGELWLRSCRKARVKPALPRNFGMSDLFVASRAMEYPMGDGLLVSDSRGDSETVQLRGEVRKRMAKIRLGTLRF